MGLTAAGTEIVTGTGTGGLSAVAVKGAAVGGVFATTALIYVLAYLDLLDTMEDGYKHVQRLLIATAIPLAMVFLGIVIHTVGNIS